jgi:hypothetical protein
MKQNVKQNMNNIIKNIRNINSIQLDDNKEYETYDLYDFVNGLWTSKISVQLENNSNVDTERSMLNSFTYPNALLILNSNHFINLIKEINDYGQEDGIYPNTIRKAHRIYSRINNNYNKLNNYKYLQNIKIINSKCVYLHTSFTSGNAGHDLFCILNTLSKFKNDEEINFIFFEEIHENNNYHIIKLFISDNKIIKINQNQIYNFKRQIFNSEIGCHNISLYKNIINDLLNKLKIKNHEILSDNFKNKFKNKKVIIIKTVQDTIVRSEDCFHAELLFRYLISENWIIIRPEKENFYKMTYILLNAKLILTSNRGISCANQIFYNLDAEIIGFIKDPFSNKLHIRNKLKNENIFHGGYDAMCNGYYYNRMKKIIFSPSNITEKNVDEFKNLNL